MTKNPTRPLLLLASIALTLSFTLSACNKTTESTLSSDKAITAFSFASPAASGTIDESAKTIAVSVPYGTAVTALVATFTTRGASVAVGIAAQVSGTTANDFTSPVTYVVTAADGSTASYVVTVMAQVSITTLTVWDFKYSDVNASGAMKTNDAAFENANPGVTVVHVAQPTDSTQYYQIIQSAATANAGPDIAMFNGGRVDGFADALVDLDSYINDVKGQFTTASIEACSLNQKLGKPVKVLPLTMQGFGIYYNKTIFKNAGLDAEKAPKSSADFLTLCAALKAAGIVPITTGQTYSIDFFLRCAVANAYGPNVAGLVDGSQKFDNPVFKESATFVKTLVDNGYIESDGLSRPYFMTAIDKFAAGGGAMFIGLISDVADWKYFSDTLGADNVGYFPAVNFNDSAYKDQLATQGLNIGYGVMKWSKNQDLAAAYVKFVTTGECVKTYTLATGTLSPNTAATVTSVAYPVLTVIQGYLTNCQKDYIMLFYSSYEDDANKLCDKAFVTKEITIDNFITQYQGLITKY
jgi:raffinose/stachyose/melibiose transport system substrate-binding protein